MEVYEKNIGWANLKRDGQRGAKDEINYLKQKILDFKVNMKIG